MNKRFKRHFYQDQAGDGSGQGGASGSGAGEGGAAGGQSGAGEGGSQGGAASGQGGAAGGAASAGSGVSDAEAKLLKENMKKKEQIESLSKQLDTAKSFQAQIEELGGVDALKALVQASKDAETKQLEAKGDFDRLRQRMAEEHTKTVKSLQEQLTALQSNLSAKDQTINNLAIGSQFSQSKFISDELTLTPAKARLIYSDYFDISQDGSVVGYDKPKGAANRTALVDGYGNSVGFDDALRKIVESDPEKDHLLKSKIKPGAASSSRQNPSSAQTSQQEISRSPISKIAAGLGSLGKIHNV